MVNFISKNRCILELDIIDAVRSNNCRKALIEDFHNGKLIGTLGYVDTDTYCLTDNGKHVLLHYHDMKELRIIGRL